MVNKITMPSYSLCMPFAKMLSLFSLLLCILLTLTSCGSGSSNPNDPIGSEEPGDGQGGGGAGGNSNHPYIFFNELIRSKLKAKVNNGELAATRYLDIVASEVDSISSEQPVEIYALTAMNQAFVYQLMDEDGSYAHYCIDVAVPEIDQFVSNEEALMVDNDPSTRPIVAYDSYLYVGQKIGDLAKVYDWCYEYLSSSQKERWQVYASQAVWNVWNHENARWGDEHHPWSGWSVNNAVNNYYYSFLNATMLYGLAFQEDASDARDWLSYFRDIKVGEQLIPRV